MMRVRWLSAAVVAASCGGGPTAMAQDRGIIPGYSDFEAMRGQVRELARRPTVEATSLTRTLGGRDVLVLTVGQGAVDNKPAILIVGSADPAHLLGSELAMRLADRLSAPDEQAARLRERLTFYIIPRPSPDASEAFFTRPYSDAGVNLRADDADNDGAIDEDGPEDLNQDGVITLMRVEDAAGEYLPSPADARLMVRADEAKGERGRYKLYVEGVDNDHDEQFNEDARGGVVFNRNFTFNYPHLREGAGPNAVSEAETRAVADFCFDHANIAAVLCFGPQDNLTTAWKPAQGGGSGRIRTSVDAADAPLMEHVAEAYRKVHGGKGAPTSGDSAGAMLHWSYFHYGRWAFGTRGWWIESKAEEPAEPRGDGGKARSAGKGKDAANAEPRSGKGAAKEQRPGDRRATQMLTALAWMKQREIEGFVAWSRVDHPDFPGKEVEVGGMKPFLLINPPPSELDRLGEAHLRFVGELASMLPRVRLGEVKAEALGGGVFRVTAEVVNDGYLPTMPAMGDVNGVPRPLQVSLRLAEGSRVLTGAARVKVEAVAGGGGRREVVWLVRTGAAELGVGVESPTVGSDQKIVRLP